MEPSSGYGQKEDRQQSLAKRLVLVASALAAFTISWLLDFPPSFCSAFFGLVGIAIMYMRVEDTVGEYDDLNRRSRIAFRIIDTLIFSFVMYPLAGLCAAILVAGGVSRPPIDEPVIAYVGLSIGSVLPLLVSGLVLSGIKLLIMRRQRESAAKKR